jgi:hypothetical protein
MPDFQIFEFFDLSYFFYLRLPVILNGVSFAKQKRRSEESLKVWKKVRFYNLPKGFFTSLIIAFAIISFVQNDTMVYFNSNSKILFLRRRSKDFRI